MFDRNDQKRDAFMLKRGFSKKGYDWWWHSFTAIDSKTGEEKQFFIEFFVINPKDGKKVRMCLASVLCCRRQNETK